jgi:hypothetical protein
MLRRGRRWHRLPSDLALEKCSISIAESLGSQREIREASGVAGDGNHPLFFPGFGGSPASSLGQGTTREKVAVSVCELAHERGVRRGANDKQRGRGEGVQGFICSRWARCRVLSSETIGGFGRCAGDGVVVSVQWCGRGARVRAVPTGRRTGSVDVQGFRVMAGRIRWPSVLGEGGAWLGLRCRAG